MSRRQKVNAVPVFVDTEFTDFARPELISLALAAEDGLTSVPVSRRHRTPKGDAQLLAELRQEIAELPSYGYRRACALVNRQRTAKGAPRVNAKRVYRVMAGADCCCPKRRADASLRVRMRVKWPYHAATCAGAPTAWKSSATRAIP